MSTGEGHRPTIKVEVDPGPSLEVDPGPSLEVDLGFILKVGPEIGQEPEVKAIIALTPRMSIPTPQNTTGNP